jgi:hypothetical protein
MSARHPLGRAIRRWHARIGALAAIFFLLLAASGMMLNHTGVLGLDAQQIRSLPLARWYGLDAEAVPWTYRFGRHVLAWGNGMWLLDGRIVAEDALPPVGLTGLDGLLYIASAESLAVYGADYRLVERVAASALPAGPITAIGLKDKQLQLRTQAGIFASADTISWKRAAEAGIAWSNANPAPSALQHELAAQLVPGISLARLLADLHSGRIFGRYGALVVDALAVLLIVLALSGGWMFVRPRRRLRRHA